MKSNNGLTLPEIMIAISVSAVVGSLLLIILVNSMSLFFRESQQVSQSLGLNDALSKIRSTVKEAQAIAASYQEGVSPTYTSGATQLVLKLPSTDSTGNMLANTFDYVVYTVDQKRLYLKIFPNSISSRQATEQILARDVGSIYFEYFDGNGLTAIPTSAVRVRSTLTLEQPVSGSILTNVATSEANLRND